VGRVGGPIDGSETNATVPLYSQPGSLIPGLILIILI
jgi:hypothetical protein